MPQDIVHTHSFLMPYQEEEIKPKIILDCYILEVFANDGKQVTSAMIYTRQTAAAIIFGAGGPVLMDVKKYDLAFDGQRA